LLLTWLGSLAQAQVLGPVRPDWRKVGTSAVDLPLVSPATGGVERVWFSPDASRLYVRTRSGKTFETIDFETWTGSAERPPAPPVPALAARLPEAGAQMVSAARSPRLYALGRHLYRSEDGGRSWMNLTAWRDESIIGPAQRSVAVSPADPDHIAVANDFGVWRSLDGGLSWTGLNQFLPNLAVRRIVSTPAGAAGARVEAEGFGTLELPPGGAVWTPVAGPASADEETRRRFSALLGADITAVAVAGEMAYAGSSGGRLWTSFDAGRTWRPSPDAPAAGPVERIFADPAEPRVALAALSGTGARLLRTTNSGVFWDDLSSNLPPGAARAVVAERAAGAVYVATDTGVYYGRADLENAGPAAIEWTPLTARLPAAAATDVRLDPQGNQLYIALEGYGLYAAAAPHRSRLLRVVSAADYTARPAAPGSLLSVVGGRVDSARAGGAAFPVLAASDSESQIQVPFEVEGSRLALALTTNRGQVTVPLPLESVSPAIFVSRDGAPMLLDADSGLLLDARNTARGRARLQVLATGLGRVRPDWPTGLAAPLDNPPEVVAGVEAYLDRVPVTVTRATLAPGYVGFYLVEIQLPALVNAGPAELYITAGARESNRVSVFVEP
jgi:uncharacterized protein (TIGR03437 family)